MDINVKVKLESPELMAAILALAESLPQMQLRTVLPIKEGQVPETNEVANKSESKNEERLKEEIKKEYVKAITLEDVRAKLSALSQSGKQKEVKELIKKYGVNKLTDIHPCNFKELLEFAEEL